jgi:nicotinamidase-related amidase
MADLGRTALLIIDMQVAMFSYGANMQPYRGKEVLHNCKRLLDGAREAGLPVVLIQHTQDEEYTRGLITWEICPELTPLPGEDVVEKPTWDAFHRTNLEQVLRSKGISNLVIAGMQTEFCVDTTSRRAYSQGFKSIIVEDAHSTFDGGNLTGEQIVQHHNRIWGGRFGQLLTTEQVIAEMQEQTLAERFA